MSKRSKDASDTRKLEKMLNELEQMKQELLPDTDKKNGVKGGVDLKDADEYTRKKAELRGYINRIRPNIERLQKLREKVGGDGKDANTIRLQSDNTSDLKQAAGVYKLMSAALAKDIEKARKKGKKAKLSPEQLDERGRELKVLGEELQLLTEQNSNIKVQSSDLDKVVTDRVEEKRAKDRIAREKRRELTRARKGKKDKGDDALVNDDDFKNTAPVGEQEMAFMQKVEENKAEQDAILEEISQGLVVLKDLANAANKELVVQAAMLEQVENKMDKTIDQFKSANRRLQELLDESGGMTRWCPILFCMVLLLALLGYIFKGNIF